ncbi:hypothetical protein [Frankia sp. CIT1]|uniref:hypothetical protein n=1 Tax=Frankia sp. CIT1 TaxID=2880974 RepID=UPI001EF61786|nr:hypothetical protein [Frankia sp. CIT1]
MTPAPVATPPAPDALADADPGAEGALSDTSDGTPTGDDAPDDVPSGPMVAFHIPIGIVEGADTSDGRFITPNALSWRDLPLPLMATRSAPHGNIPTTDAVQVGRITAHDRRDVSGESDGRGGTYPEGTLALYGSGEFDVDDESQAYAAKVYSGQLNGVSADLADVDAEWEVLEEDEDGYPTAERMSITRGEVLGYTLVPHPAFAGCYMVGADADGNPMPHPRDTLAPDGGDEDAVAASGWRPRNRPYGARRCIPCEQGGALVASAGPMEPPAAWFDDPHLSELTPLTITADGWVYGHLAGWGTCHTGVSGACVTPPRGGTYAYYRTGAVLAAGGALVATGPITMGTGHASTAAGTSAAEAIAHYDNTGTAVADVAAGEDAYGIWFAGAMRPDVTDMQVRALRASGLSGDWRMLGGRLQLVAALAVNVQGFPVPRALAASGTPVALVAAGARTVLAAGRRGLTAEEIDAHRRATREARSAAQVSLAVTARTLRAAMHAR